MTLSRSVLLRAGLGAILVGLGLGLIASARRSACGPCEESAEETAAKVAAAGAPEDEE